MSDTPKVSRLSGGLQPLNQEAKRQQTPVLEATGASEKERVREEYRRDRDLSKIRVIPARAESSPFDPRFRKRVVVYCRVSTDGIQQTTSFELQKKYYLRYVRKKPEWKLVGLYSDEGITATSIEKRIGLLTMLNDARAGKFDIIVVKNLSRLCRNLMDCMNIIYELRRLPHPVGILFENENMYTLDKNVDFTLQVLSLVAQEESHKKSEAMISSYQQRFGNGQFMKPDLLGYDRVGKNEIGVNVEEAQTVQLIFMMYLAQISPNMIAEVLIMLGRKTHTHHYKDGRIKEGVISWSADSVLNILKNERRCGNVLAQKTYTPNYLDHKSKTNYDALPKFFAVDQHPAIVSPYDFYMTQKMIAANRGGWKQGLQQLEIFETGFMSGCVSTIPNWLGFGAEDYNRAALRCYGMPESELNEIEARINAESGDANNGANSSMEFQHSFSIDSDDYEMFPDAEETQEEVEKEDRKESFRRRVSETREKRKYDIDVKRISTYDLSRCEVVRAEFFNTRDKATIRLDARGISFSRSCYDKLKRKRFTPDYVELNYDPVEQMLVVQPTRKVSAKSVKWTALKDGVITMHRCGIKGLAGAIYTNMQWDEDYKYRIVGTVVGEGNKAVLVFYLNEPQIIVPAKPGTVKNLDTDITPNLTKEILHDGYLPEQGFVPDLSDFDLGNGPVASAAKRLSRSRAIYYDEMMDQSAGNISVLEMGNKKYDPEFIQRLIQKGLKPTEGWSYLRGMATIREKSFSIYPASWADSFGMQIYKRNTYRLMLRKEQINAAEKTMPYGWTIGLDLPTKKTVEETIEYLKTKMA